MPQCSRSGLRCLMRMQMVKSILLAAIKEWAGTQRCGGHDDSVFTARLDILDVRASRLVFSP